jgi:hypothetical protein
MSLLDDAIWKALDAAQGNEDAAFRAKIRELVASGGLPTELPPTVRPAPWSTPGNKRSKILVGPPRAVRYLWRARSQRPVFLHRWPGRQSPRGLRRCVEGGARDGGG